MSRRKKSSGDGFLGCGILVALFLAIFGSVIEYIANNWQLFLGLGIFIIVPILIAAINKTTSPKRAARRLAKQKIQIEKSRKEQQLSSIVRSSPVIPEPPVISVSQDFSCPEEERINARFRSLFPAFHNIKVFEIQIKHENQKIASYRNLDRYQEAANSSKAVEGMTWNIASLRRILGQGMELPHYASTSENVDRLQKEFREIVAIFPRRNLDVLGNLFDSPQLATLHAGWNSVLIFTPYYVILFTGSENNLKIIRYSEISIRTTIYEERQGNQPLQDDEIARLGWWHENKDGSPDRRYKTNHGCAYVYRGLVEIQVNNHRGELKYSNRAKAIAYANKLNAYKNLATIEYGQLVRKILISSSEDEIASALASSGKCMSLKSAEQNQVNQHVHADAATVQPKLAESKMAERLVDDYEKVVQAQPPKIDEITATSPATQKDTVIKRKGWTGIAGLQPDYDLGLLQSAANEPFVPEMERILRVDVGTSENYSKEEKEQKEQKELPSAQPSVDDFIVMEGNLVNYFGLNNHVILPDNIVIIGERVFSYNRFLQTVEVPEGAMRIESRAFFSCPELKSIYLPDSITYISEDAFLNSPNLQMICLHGSYAAWYAVRNKIPHTIKDENQSHVLNQQTTYMFDDEIRTVRLEQDSFAGSLASDGSEPIDSLEEKESLQSIETDFQIGEYHHDRAVLKLDQEQRIISNNLFNLHFQQTEPVSANHVAAEYEVFFVDESYGKVSDTHTIKANKQGDEELTFRCTFTLLAGGSFDKDADYFLIIRYKKSGNEILEKIPFRIDVTFAPLFEW